MLNKLVYRKAGLHAYARRPEGCLCALPFFVCTRQEISFSNGVKSRKKFHCALKAPVLGGATSPPLRQQKILLFLGRFTIQAGSLMSCFEVAEKNKLLKRPQASKMQQRKHGVSPADLPGSECCIHQHKALREPLASLCKCDSPSKGIKRIWGISQEQSDTGRQRQVQTIAATLSRELRKAGKAGHRANMHPILET